MASTAITLTANTQDTSDVRSLLANMQTTSNNVRALKDRFDALANNGDWDALATALGTDATSAQAVYNMLGTANTNIVDASDIQQLLARIRVQQ